MSLQNHEKVWVGLLNPGRITCKGAECSGKLKWSDGQVFQHASWMGTEVPNFTGKVCSVMSPTGFDEEICNGHRQLICVYDCTGSSTCTLGELMAS